MAHLGQLRENEKGPAIDVWFSPEDFFNEDRFLGSTLSRCVVTTAVFILYG